jgi:anti-anti-sigma factor
MDDVTDPTEPDATEAPMTFAIDTDDAQTTIVTIGGELDISNVGRLERAVAPVIASRPARLVLELGGVQFADSSAIALWVRWATAVGELTLREAPPLLRTVIETMGLAGKLRLTS